MQGNGQREVALTMSSDEGQPTPHDPSYARLSIRYQGVARLYNLISRGMQASIDAILVFECRTAGNDHYDAWSSDDSFNRSRGISARLLSDPTAL